MFNLREIMPTTLLLVAMILGPQQALAEGESNIAVGKPATPNPWISIAAGIYKSGDTTYVNTAFSRNTSRQKAIDNAVENCFRSGNQNCRSVGAWNQGCIYITTTTSENDGGATAWGSGPTAQAAYDNCRNQQGVVQCVTKTIGGCVN